MLKKHTQKSVWGQKINRGKPGQPNETAGLLSPSSKLKQYPCVIQLFNPTSCPIFCVLALSFSKQDFSLCCFLPKQSVLQETTHPSSQVLPNQLVSFKFHFSKVVQQGQPTKAYLEVCFTELSSTFSHTMCITLVYLSTKTTFTFSTHTFSFCFSG